MTKMYVVTLGRANLGEMDEWSRHRTLTRARKEAMKMSTKGHRRLANGTPQLATIWSSDDWDSDGSRPVRPIAVYEPKGF